MRASGVVLALGAAVFVGRATAGPGTAGGASTSVLVWQGTLTGATATTPFRFEFKKASSVVCTVNTVPTKAVGDAVTVNVDYRTGTGAGCTTKDLFDGADVTVTVTASGAILADQPLGAVAYAKYADKAASAPWSGIKATVAASDPWPGRLVKTVGTTSISVGGAYCGKTANTTGKLTAAGGTVTGWRAAKALCEAACGASPTAHMCSSDEMIRSVQLAIDLPTAGWYATGSRGSQPESTMNDGDCQAWTNETTSTYGGLYWYAPSGSNTSRPNLSTCNSSMPVFCCD